MEREIKEREREEREKARNVSHSVCHDLLFLFSSSPFMSDHWKREREEKELALFPLISLGGLNALSHFYPSGVNEKKKEKMRIKNPSLALILFQNGRNMRHVQTLVI